MNFIEGRIKGEIKPESNNQIYLTYRKEIEQKMLMIDEIALIRAASVNDYIKETDQEPMFEAAMPALKRRASYEIKIKIGSLKQTV